jgi:phosphoribosylanthranilate isomerase
MPGSSPAWPAAPIVQIAGVSDLAEARMLAAAGVDWLGFPLRLAVHAPDLSEDAAARIIRTLRPPHAAVLITYLDRAAAVVDLCRRLGVRRVQLHGPVPAAELAAIKARDPGLLVIKSLVVPAASPPAGIAAPPAGRDPHRAAAPAAGRDPDRAAARDPHRADAGADAESADRAAPPAAPPGQPAEAELHAASPHVDAFILDTYDPATGASGATGKTHDWAVSRRLVAISPRPVLLAGGLHPANVAQAIRTVRPAGVDAHTGVEGADGRKDPDRVRAFLAAARAAFAETAA